MPKKKIGELLVESGALSAEQVNTALGRQRNRGHSQRLGSVIITLGFASPAEVARALARQANLPFVQLPEQIDEAVQSLVSLDFQSEHRLVPFRIEREGRSERLHVAVDDPSDLTVAEELGFQLNKPVRIHVAAEDDLDRALGLVRGLAMEGLPLEEDDALAALEIEHGHQGGVVPGGWHEPSEEPTPSLPGTPSLGEWELPPTQALGDDDAAPTFIHQRYELKPKPPAPPAPPPFEDDEEEITLITPKPTAKASARPPPPPPPQESEEVLDELLGEPDDEPTQPGTPKAGVPVVMFGGAAKGTPLPPRAEPPDITEEDLKVLEDLDRMADGTEAVLVTEKVKPARMVATLIRLLIRKRVIREEEFLEELSRK